LEEFKYSGRVISTDNRLMIKIKDFKIDRLQRLDQKDQAITTAHKQCGFQSNLQVHHPHQSYVSIDRNVVPQSLTGHTANVSQLSNEDDLKYIEKQLKDIGHKIGYFRQGNSLH
jgi:hypothetical protein